MSIAPFPSTGSKDDLLGRVLDYLRKYETERKGYIENMWSYWRGDQQRFVKKYKGESNDEYLERIARIPVENHCRPTSNINVSFMYGVYDKIIRRADNTELNKLLHDDVYEINEMSAFMIDCRLVTSVTGFSCVELTPLNKMTRKLFNTADEITKENLSILYTLNDSVDLIPFPRVYDRRSLGAVIKVYELDSVDQYMGFKIPYRPDTDVLMIEFIDDTKWYRWWTYKKEGEKFQELAVFPSQPGVNVYGDVRIPFVIFKNIGDPMSVEGDSDIADIAHIQNSINERNGDDELVMQYHSMPILKLLNGAKMPKNFIRKPNSALEFDGEGNAEYLTWEDKLEASTQFKNDMRQAIREVTQVSGLARGNMQEIGQLKTGIGVKSLFVPDIIGVRLRRPFMIKGEKDLIWSTAKMYEYYGKYDFKGNYKCEVILPEDFLGIDEWMETQIQQMKANMGLPITNTLKQEFPDETDDELEEREDEIKERGGSRKGVSPPPEQKSLEKE